MRRISITGEDLQTLEGLNWLNDNIVNFYMSMIEVLFQVLSSTSQFDLTQARSTTDKNLPSSYSFSTFFYPRLQEVPISYNLFAFLQPSPSSITIVIAIVIGIVSVIVCHRHPFHLVHLPGWPRGCCSLDEEC